MRKLLSIVTVGVVLSLLVPATVRAEDQEKAKQELSKLWNTEAMMRQAAENIGRRYNLNEDQLEYTHAMLTDRVNRFLEEHDDIWPLLRDLARYQISGKTPEGDSAKRIGDAAMPLLADIRESILEANQQWRNECLVTEEQLRMHDYDLQDMEKTFQRMENNFGAMSGGTPVEQGVLPGPNDMSDQPLRPKKPKAKPDAKYDPTSVRVVAMEESWAQFVRAFIRRYQLDDSQSEAAFNILRDCQDRARTYRDKMKAEFAEAAAKAAEIRKPNPGLPDSVWRAKIMLVSRMEKRLNKPIHDLFDELQSRLQRIPTDAQRLRADGRLKEKTKRSRTVKRPNSKSTDSASAKSESQGPKNKSEASKDKPTEPEDITSGNVPAGKDPAQAGAPQ